MLIKHIHHFQAVRNIKQLFQNFCLPFKMMEPHTDPAKVILIKSRNKVLSATELTTHRHVETESEVRTGLKRTFPSDGPEEAQELQKLYADLRAQLSVSRIDRLSGRSLATWDTEEQAVLVLRKDGKFGSFGYNRNGKLYLEPFEALFLLELGRLQLEYNAMIVSVEQAYLLLLGEATTIKYNEYLVYSSLSRVGYILVKHQNQIYTEPTAAVTQIDCAWALLQKELQQIPIPNYIKKSQFYPKAVEHMEQTKTKIMLQQSAVEDGEQPITSINFNQKIVLGAKRKNANESDNATASKRSFCAPIQHSFVDFLHNEPEYEKFRHIFQKFDIVKMQSPQSSTDDCVISHFRTLKIAFDLYLHNDGFKKSRPKAPIFRLVVLAPNEPFPTHAEIARCHREQKHGVPLLVLSISDSKQIQAFLYYFT